MLRNRLLFIYSTLLLHSLIKTLLFKCFSLIAWLPVSIVVHLGAMVLHLRIQTIMNRLAIMAPERTEQTAIWPFWTTSLLHLDPCWTTTQQKAANIWNVYVTKEHIDQEVYTFTIITPWLLKLLSVDSKDSVWKELEKTSPQLKNAELTQLTLYKQRKRKLGCQRCRVQLLCKCFKSAPANFKSWKRPNKHKTHDGPQATPSEPFHTIETKHSCIS